MEFEQILVYGLLKKKNQLFFIGLSFQYISALKIEVSSDSWWLHSALDAFYFWKLAVFCITDLILCRITSPRKWGFMENVSHEDMNTLEGHSPCFFV